MRVVIKPSTNKNKKYTAIFYDDKGKKIKTSSFGDSKYSDYIQHKDKTRRVRGFFDSQGRVRPSQPRVTHGEADPLEG